MPEITNHFVVTPSKEVVKKSRLSRKLTVFPAKEGVRKIADRPDQRCASFETSLREAPQDEDFSSCHQRITSC
jgi:hypothetical protein